IRNSISMQRGVLWKGHNRARYQLSNARIFFMKISYLNFSSVRLLTLGVTLLCLIAATACRQDMHDQPKYIPFTDNSARQFVEGTVSRGSYRPSARTSQPGNGVATTQGQNAGTGSQAQMGTTQAAVPNNSTTNNINDTSRSQLASSQQPAGPAQQATTPGVDVFPFPITETVLRRGQERYNIFCSPCHSQVGDGRGMIVQRGFRQPPSYHIDRLRQAPASHFFDVITNGFGAMPSYAEQIPTSDRWASIAYIRALQLSQNAPM